MYLFSAIEDMQFFQKYQFNLDIEYIQVQKGQYQGEIQLHISNDEKSAAIKEVNSTEVIINGVPFTDNYLIGFIPHQADGFNYSINKAKKGNEGRLFIFPPNQEVTAKLGKNSTTHQYVIQEEKFNAVYQTLFHDDPQIKSTLEISESLSPEIFAKIERCFSAIYKAEVGDVEFWMKELEYYIFLLLEKNQESLPCAMALYCPPKIEELKKFQGILSFIQSNIKLPIDYPMLCEQFFITRKTLERLFIREIGLTPFKYIHFYRLKCINNILIVSNNNTLNLHQLTMSYGMNHYGRFSKNYQGLFGESPKKTLLKKSNILLKGLYPLK